MSQSSLAVVPLRVAQNEIWVEVGSGKGFAPGRMVRLEPSTPTEAPVYAQIIVVEAAGSRPSGENREAAVRLTLQALAGKPSMAIRAITPLGPDEAFQAVTALLSPITAPFRMAGRVAGDRERLGALTLLEGDCPASRRALIKAFARAISSANDGGAPALTALIIDPCGLLGDLTPEEDDFRRVFAGPDVQLSLQALGMSTFLAAMESALPPAFRVEALHVLVKGMPLTLDFIPFEYLLSPKRYWDSPAKLPLLHALYAIHQNRAFADRPEDMFVLSRLIGQEPTTVLDLSALQDPWRAVFYHHACQALLKSPEVQAFPILIEPETWLEPAFLSAWLQQFEKTRGHGVAVVSGTAPGASLMTLAESRLSAFRRPGAGDLVEATICGRVSAHLPLTLSLGEEAPLASADETSAPDATAPGPDASPASFAPFPETTSYASLSDAAASRTSVMPEFESEADWMGAPSPPPETPPTSQSEASAPQASSVESVSPAVFPTSVALNAPPDAVMNTPIAPPEPLDLSRTPASTEEAPPPPLDAFIDEPAADELYVLSASPVTVDPQAPSVEMPTDQPHLQTPLPQTKAPIPEPAVPPRMEMAGLEDLYPPSSGALGLKPPASESHPDLDALFQPSAPADAASGDTWDFDFDPAFEPASPVRVEALSSPAPDVPTSPAVSPATPAPVSAAPPAPSPAPSLHEPLPVYQHEQPEARKAQDAAGFEVGDRVSHPQYGVGLIQKVIPMEGRVTLKIFFDEVGKRLLDAKTAPLTKMDPL